MCTLAAAHKRAEPCAEPSPEAAAFADSMIDMLNKAATAMMVSIGHRTGLFETMSESDADTSDGWARRTGLDERYVREWLAAMAVAGIVDIGTDGRTYRLPEAQAFSLGRDAPGGNLACMMQWVGVLAPVESRIVDCFRNGGGVPYEAFNRFHEVMAEESGQTIDLDATIALVPGLEERLRAGIDVVDVGCGLGRILRDLAGRYPASRFTGYDLSVDAIAQANAETAAAGLRNAGFHALDAMEMTDTAAFDLVFTFDAVHDQPHPARLLENIRRSLRADGVYVMQDIWAATPVADNLDHPMAPFLYTISTMHCMTVSLAQGGIGLGAAWGEQLARAMIDEAGFGSCDMYKLPHDIQNAYYICRP